MQCISLDKHFRCQYYLVQDTWRGCVESFRHDQHTLDEKDSSLRPTLQGFDDDIRDRPTSWSAENSFTIWERSMLATATAFSPSLNVSIFPTLQAANGLHSMCTCAVSCSTTWSVRSSDLCCNSQSVWCGPATRVGHQIHQSSWREALVRDGEMPFC